MQKKIKLLLLLFVTIFCVPVFAANHTVGEVVPASEVSTVETDLFTYTGLSYVPNVSGKSYGRFSFQNITNKSNKSIPISIDILVFDENQKNIGFVTYCTEQDFGGDFAQKKLNVGGSSNFYINVVDKYFVEDKGPQDVSYYAVLDDNPYCHVGGYDKYEGLTMEEIASGTVTIKSSDGESIPYNQEFINLLSSISWGFVIGLLFGVFVVYIVQGIILNALHKRMFGSTTALAYLPITNQYLAVKLAFGSSPAKIFVIAYIVSVILSFTGFLAILSLLISLVSGFAFIIVIVKLITKKYDLLYMEPMTQNQNVDLDKVGPVDRINHPVKEVSNENVEEHTSFLPKQEELEEDSHDNSFIPSDGQATVDLTYNSSNNGGFIETDTSDSFSFDAQDFNSSLSNDGFDSTTSANDNSTNTNTENQNEGESELMDLFK